MYVGMHINTTGTEQFFIQHFVVLPLKQALIVDGQMLCRRSPDAEQDVRLL